MRTLFWESTVVETTTPATAAAESLRLRAGEHDWKGRKALEQKKADFSYCQGQQAGEFFCVMCKGIGALCSTLGSRACRVYKSRGSILSC
ncbi:hypothetical protein R1flu_015405 [Riccia fluitans]|uniref:Uncharacterized protein n=1 Tax=Riccia fluitans TaxID=41844 RepID=A0ABD1YJW6_9MARC